MLETILIGVTIGLASIIFIICLVNIIKSIVKFRKRDVNKEENTETIKVKKEKVKKEKKEKVKKEKVKDNEDLEFIDSSESKNEPKLEDEFKEDFSIFSNENKEEPKEEIVNEVQDNVENEKVEESLDEGTINEETPGVIMLEKDEGVVVGTGKVSPGAYTIESSDNQESVRMRISRNVMTLENGSKVEFNDHQKITPLSGPVTLKK